MFSGLCEIAMIVCHCRGITDRDVRCAIREGARDIRAVTRACGASLECGGCRPQVRKILRAELESETRFLPVLQAALIGG